jgi:hypothetical protein
LLSPPPYFRWPRRRHRPGFATPLVSAQVDGGVATPSSMPSCGRCVDASTTVRFRSARSCGVVLAAEFGMRAGPRRKARMTSKEVAQWMLDQMGSSHWLHQEAIAQRIQMSCGEEFVYRTESAASERPCWSSLEGLPKGNSFGSLASVHGGASSGGQQRGRERWAGQPGLKTSSEAGVPRAVSPIEKLLRPGGRLTTST